MNLRYDNRCKEFYWLVKELGIHPKRIPELTQLEIDQLKRGQELYNEEQQRSADRGRAPSPDQQRREQEALQKYA